MERVFFQCSGKAKKGHLKRDYIFLKRVHKVSSVASLKTVNLSECISYFTSMNDEGYLI